MRKALTAVFIFSLFLGSYSQARWVDPATEAKKNHRVKAWQGLDYTFTGFSSSSGTSAITYRSALSDYWEWNGGTGIDSLGWFFTGGGRYFFYNWPKTTCFFAFNCHGQVSGGANLYFANGGRKTYENSGVQSIYDQGNSMYALPSVAFRSIYQEFFSLTLDVGYRFMIQKPNINRSYGPLVQANVDEMNKANENGFGASVSLGIVF
ncbi:hypothetical protein [Bdellovibrio sp. HCB337]|uniref:hypothetical protein n=1 Tax=Bdellovibrio sp. HCB337 TaxID=3394358 RepID=UPI0039A45DCE